jgi:hypothetical protein
MRRFDFACLGVLTAFSVVSCGGVVSESVGSSPGEPPSSPPPTEPSVVCPATSLSRLAPLSPGMSMVSANGLAQMGEFVYFTSANQDGSPGAVYRVSKCGGPTTKLATAGERPGSIAVDAARVYWADEIFGTIASVPREGGDVRTLVEASEHVPSGALSLTQDTANLYWVTIPTGYVLPPYGMQFRTMQKNGTGDVALVSSNTFVLTAAAGPAGVYVAEGEESTRPDATPSVYEATSGTALLTIEAGTECQILTVDATYAYCSSGTTITRLPLDGGAAAPPLDMHRVVSGATVADGEIYVTTSCTTLTNSVTCTSDDAELVVVDASGHEASFATGLSYPTVVVVDEVNAYFADVGGVYAIQRPR